MSTAAKPVRRSSVLTEAVMRQAEKAREEKKPEAVTADEKFPNIKQNPFFQLVFAGTAATIVSGAVAERIKYSSFIIFTFFMGMVIYPVVGHWIWGGGFLSSKGFVDFVWACTRGLRSYIAALALLSAAIAAYEAWLFALLGQVVDWLGRFAPGELWREQRGIQRHRSMLARMVSCLLARD